MIQKIYTPRTMGECVVCEDRGIIMEAMRKSWTDERLDDFRTDVNRRFDEVDRRFDKVDHELRRINDRLDTLSRALVFGAISMTGGILASFGAMIALIVTRT